MMKCSRKIARKLICRSIYTKESFIQGAHVYVAIEQAPPDFNKSKRLYPVLFFHVDNSNKFEQKCEHAGLEGILHCGVWSLVRQQRRGKRTGNVCWFLECVMVFSWERWHFPIYGNDLTKEIEHSITKYGDDTKLRGKSHRKEQRDIQSAWINCCSQSSLWERNSHTLDLRTTNQRL